jgi:hypothetical protein
MNNSGIKSYIRDQHAAGVSKPDIYHSLIDKDVPAKKAAIFISQFCDPKLRQEHAGKVNLVLAILVAQLLIGLWISWEMAVERDISPVFFMGFMGFIALFASVMLWGVWADVGPMYNSIMLLTGLGTLQTLPALGSDPIAIVGLIIPVGVILVVYNTRSNVFPYLGLFGPKMNNGEFLFLPPHGRR